MEPTTSPMTPWYRSPLVWILAVGAVVRLGLWLAAAGMPLNVWDERDYNTLALNLTRHGEFSFTPGTLASLRPPLYPAVVSGFYRLFGEENFQAVRLFQAALSLGTVALVYWIGKTVASRTAGLWAAAICCFYPSLLGFNNLILTEVQFTFLLVAAIALLVLALKRQSVAVLAAAGVVIGLAALTRSVMWLFPPVLGIFLLIAWKGGFVKRSLAVAAMVVTFAVTIAPWSIRNSQLEQTFVVIDTMGGRNFMMGNYQHTPLYRSWDAISLQGEQSWHHEVHEAYPQEERSTQGKVDKLAFKQGAKFIAANPGLTLQRDVIKFFDFWGLERELPEAVNRGYFGHWPTALVVGFTLLVCGGYAFVLIAGLFGMIAAPPLEWRYHVLFLLTLAFICGMHTLVFAHSRYHLPLLPLLMVYAGSALVHVPALARQRVRWPVYAAAAVSVVFVASWVWRLVVADLDHVLAMLNIAG